MTDPVEFRLTEGERSTPLWARLKRELIGRLEIARIKNDATTLTEQQTAALRGQIRTLKGLIALGDDRPPTGD